MGWDDLRGLAASGWEIGSHTCSHPRLSQLEDSEILKEMGRSREICEREMGTPCHSFAYPYSDYDERAVRAAREAGYRFAATVPRGPQAPLPLQWPRVGVYYGESARRVRGVRLRPGHRPRLRHRGGAEGSPAAGVPP
jgi:peptidoglycan/xylan/chitin deacetylase (PgdA/CDA1 family)